MKTKTFFLPAMCLFLISSCSKEEQDSLATFSFRINNGPVIEWNDPNSNNSICAECGPEINKDPAYFILRSRPTRYAISIVLTFNSPEISVGTYTETVGPNPETDPSNSLHMLLTEDYAGASSEEGDFATITFTRVQDGKYFDGTFRARLTALTFGPDTEKLEIVGEFHNVRLH